MTFAALEAEFEVRLDQCWRSITVADVAQLGNRAWPTISRDVRASASVLAVAEFEGLLKESVELLNHEIEQSGSLVGDLRPGIRMLHLESVLGLATSSNLDNAWEARLGLAFTDHVADPPVLPRRDPRGFIQPIGRSTPRPSTIARLWRVYGFGGTPFPNLEWRRALGELADIRNDVAHRKERLTVAMGGAGRSADAIGSYVISLRDLGRHLVTEIEGYALASRFLAPN